MTAGIGRNLTEGEATAVYLAAYRLMGDVASPWEFAHTICGEENFYRDDICWLPAHDGPHSWEREVPAGAPPLGKPR